MRERGHGVVIDLDAQHRASLVRAMRWARRRAYWRGVAFVLATAGGAVGVALAMYGAMRAWEAMR